MMQISDQSRFILPGWPDISSKSRIIITTEMQIAISQGGGGVFYLLFVPGRKS